MPAAARPVVVLTSGDGATRGRAVPDQAASSMGGGCMAPVMIATASDIE